MTSPLFCPLEPAWGDVATWFAGFASVAAVVVALYLARHADKPKAEAWLADMIFSDDWDVTVFSYQMTNLGTHPIRISGCSVQLVGIAKWRMKYSACVANNWQHGANSRIPCLIQRGETFRYGTPVRPFIPFFAKSRLPGWLLVHFVRASVDTPWGPVRCKISKDMKKTWRSEIAEYRAAPHPREE
jgi:hypothetical protein